MKAIVVGMGIQGVKRKKFLGKDFVFSVDKFKKADYRSILDVPIKFSMMQYSFVCLIKKKLN